MFTNLCQVAAMRGHLMNSDLQKLAVKSLICLAEEYPHLRDMLKFHLHEKIKKSKTLYIRSQRMLHYKYFNSSYVNAIDGYAMLGYCCPCVEVVDIFLDNFKDEAPENEDSFLPLTYLYVGEDEVIIENMEIMEMLTVVTDTILHLKTLKLCIGFDPIFIRSVIDLFSECTRLETLVLSNMTMNSDLLQHISSTVTEVFFFNIHFDPFPIINHLVKLISITVDIDFEQLCVLLIDLGKHCVNLESLHVRYNLRITKWKDDLRQVKSHNLSANNFRPLRKLQKVELENFWISLDSILLKILTVCFKQAKSLIVKASLLNTRHLFALIKHFKRLEILNLNACRVYQHVKMPSIIPLKELKLDMCSKISDQAIINLISASPNLSSIEIRGQTFNMELIKFCIEISFRWNRKLYLKTSAFFADLVLVIYNVEQNYPPNNHLLLTYYNVNKNSYSSDIQSFIDENYRNVVMKKFVITTRRDKYSVSNHSL